jgi:hypothetical protein
VIEKLRAMVRRGGSVGLREDDVQKIPSDMFDLIEPNVWLPDVPAIRRRTRAYLAGAEFSGAVWLHARIAPREHGRRSEHRRGLYRRATPTLRSEFRTPSGIPK